MQIIAADGPLFHLALAIAPMLAQTQADLTVRQSLQRQSHIGQYLTLPDASP